MHQALLLKETNVNHKKRGNEDKQGTTKHRLLGNPVNVTKLNSRVGRIHPCVRDPIPSRGVQRVGSASLGYPDETGERPVPNTSNSSTCVSNKNGSQENVAHVTLNTVLNTADHLPKNSHL